nr:hypothetical protein [Xanthomonas citri]
MRYQRLRLRSLTTRKDLYSHSWARKEITHPAPVFDDVALTRKSQLLKLLGKTIKVQATDFGHRRRCTGHTAIKAEFEPSAIKLGFIDSKSITSILSERAEGPISAFIVFYDLNDLPHCRLQTLGSEVGNGLTAFDQRKQVDKQTLRSGLVRRHSGRAG